MQITSDLKFSKIVIIVSLCAYGLCQSPTTIASDWVEDDVTEFRQTETKRSNADQSGEPGQNYSPSNSYNPKGNIDSKPTNGQSRPQSTKSSNTTDTSKPLEASVSTFKKDYRRPSRFPGLDAYANNIMESAPMIPIPTKDEAVNPGAYKAWLNATHPGVTDNLSRESIIEVKGKWDDSGHVLRSLGIPHKRIPAGKLGDTNLDNVYIVVVNCAGDLPAEAILSLRRYVGMGGFLLTTDWALDGVLKKAFPGFVAWNGGYTASKVVDAVVVDPDPQLFKNTPPIAFWKLDKKSQTVKVNRPGLVRVLARSRLLSRMEPSQFGILAFTMDFRQGKILHLVGHFDNNSDRAFNNALPDPAPGIKISMRQALAANFIVQAINAKKSAVN